MVFGITMFILCTIMYILTDSNDRDKAMFNYIKVGTVVVAICLFIIATRDAKAAQLHIMESGPTKNIVYLVGSIRNGDSEDLAFILDALTKQYPDASTTVWLTSPGGHAMEGWTMAATIKHYGANTYVPSNTMCASACTFAFMGGKSRINHGTLGYHLVYFMTTPGVMVPESQLVAAFADGQVWGFKMLRRFMHYAERHNEFKLMLFLENAMTHAYENNNDTYNLLGNMQCEELGICT